MTEISDRYTERLRTLDYLAQLAGSESGERAGRLRVIVAPEAGKLRAGQLAALTLVNLAARLTDRIDVRADKASAFPGVATLLADEEFSARSLAAMANRMWGQGEFTADAAGDADVTVGFGEVTDPLTLGIGVDETWAAVIQAGASVPMATDRAMAGMVAGAVGAAQCAKLLYPALGGRVDPLVRVAQGPFGAPLDSATAVIRGRPILVGVGAIGCGVLFALIGAEATGELIVIDRDLVRDRDLMRYILFDDRHLDDGKVHAAAALTESTGLRLDPHRQIFAEYLGDDPARRDTAELVLSLVDSYDQRRSIAAELPRQVLNSSTADRDFSVSFHGLGDGFPCLRCLYPQRPADTSVDAVMAAGLALDIQFVRGLRASREPMGLERVRAIALAQGREPDAFDAFAEDPLESFYRRTCGMTPADRHGETFAPIAFLPALAGFMTASALLGGETGSRYFRMDVFDGLMTPRRGRRQIEKNCDVCGVPALARAYQQRWGARR